VLTKKFPIAKFTILTDSVNSVRLTSTSLITILALEFRKVKGSKTVNSVLLSYASLVLKVIILKMESV